MFRAILYLCLASLGRSFVSVHPIRKEGTVVMHGPVARGLDTTTRPSSNHWVPMFPSALLAEKPKPSANIDGAAQGQVILGVALLVCVWFFTVPPSFRRAKICISDTSQVCVEKSCNCVLFQDWSNNVVEYYKNGGGIQWDFSVDPATVAANKAKLKSIGIQWFD
jgi:hypothetical protein